MLPMRNTADQKLVRHLNNNLVMDILRQKAPISRANLSALSGLNRSTVSSIMNDLLNEGWVKETIYESDNIGRPGLLLELNPSNGFVLGMEIGVDFILAVVTDFTTKVIWRERITTNPDIGMVAILEEAFKLARKAIEFGNSQCNRALGIGLAFPGLVDEREGILKFAPNLKWRDVPIRLIWTQQFNLPVFLENDGDAAAYGEYLFGAAKGIDNFIYIAAGFGLGSGIFIEGKLLGGNKGYASEVGHMTCDPNGELCSCGKHGCYETLISPVAVIKRVKKFLKEKGEESAKSKLYKMNLDAINYDAIVDAARENDPIALEALQDVGGKLGIVVANLVNVFDPKMVILGGALTYARDFIQPEVEKMVKANALQLCQEDLVITYSMLDQDSAVMGAAGLVFRNIWEESV
jgi:glucokinase-like ROK family protein